MKGLKELLDHVFKHMMYKDNDSVTSTIEGAGTVGKGAVFLYVSKVKLI